jgi:hypothetical protein
MRRKIEIHALEYCLIEFLTDLDRLFAATEDATGLGIRGGMDIELQGDDGDEHQIRAIVMPVVWEKTGRIHVRLYRHRNIRHGNWHAFEGSVSRLQALWPGHSESFNFKCRRGLLDRGYVFEGLTPTDDALLQKLAAK